VFEYNQSAPVNVEEIVSSGIRFKDIQYPSPVNGNPIRAYMVLPPEDGKYPAVLYVHWYETVCDYSNRSQYLDEAAMLAKDGVISMMVQTMWSSVPWFSRVRKLETDYDASVQQVIELRRALDVLLAQPEVDPTRIAYVGHDFGSMYGATMAGVEDRVTAYVLIAGTPRYHDWYFFGTNLSEDERSAYIEKMSPLDPIRHAPNIAPASVLFQFGNQDFYVSPQAAQEFYEAASEPKQILQYDAEHDMHADQIREDRLNFLRRELGLAGPGN
jgi:dienelactone hydrolase